VRCLQTNGNAAIGFAEDFDIKEEQQGMERTEQMNGIGTQPGRWRLAAKAAFPVTIPVLTGFLCLGMAYGVLMQSKGYGPFWAVLMSAIAFGGSMQFVAITLLTTAFDPVQAFLLSIMVNARHLFYGLSLLEKYRGLGKVRAFLIYTLCDETFSLVSTVDPPLEVAPRDFYLCISLMDYLYWIVGTAIGGILGNFLTFDTTGLDFALTALFVVLFLEQWKKRENRPAGIIGISCAVVSLLVFGPDNLVIPAMVLMTAVLLGGRKTLCT
jgi:4-azaleucine resistance transporter AzlC